MSRLDLLNAVVECFKEMHGASSSEELTDWLRKHVESAAADGDFDRFTYLIAAVVKGGVELEGYRGRDNRTLLDAAAFGGNADIVGGLLNSGALPDLNVLSQPSGRSALYQATILRHEEAACRLVDAGANVQFCDPMEHCFVLLAAAQRGLQKLAILLLEKGADVEVCETRSKRNVLHIAARCGSDVLVRHLMVHGVLDINALSANGSTPLIYAASRGHAVVVDTLLKNNADVDIRTGDLAAVTYAAKKGHAEVLQAFAKHGMDFNTGGEDGPLLGALSCGQEDVIDVLIAGGADIEMKLYGGMTALQVTIAYGPPEIKLGVMDRLLFHGADVSKTDDDGFTTLTLACYFQRRGFAEAIDRLLRKGADETVPGPNGMTPEKMLEWCIDSEDKERARLLLQRAPNDRAWRRRSWLVILKTRALNAAEAARANGDVPKASRVDHADLNTDFGNVVESLVRVGEGIFRNVMSFL